MIGDKTSDIEVGKNVGIGLNILISPNIIFKELL
jgi:histidinol phosphatase-like enzyme